MVAPALLKITGYIASQYLSTLSTNTYYSGMVIYYSLLVFIPEKKDN